MPDGFILLAEAREHPDPDVKASIKYAELRGMSTRDLWYFKMGTVLNGRFRRRVIIPSFDDQGDLNYFVARSYDDNWKKYLNPEASKDIIFNELYLDFDDDNAFNPREDESLL